MSHNPCKAWSELRKAMGMLKVDEREVTANRAISEEFSKFFATSGHFRHEVNINSMSCSAQNKFRAGSCSRQRRYRTLDLLLGLNIQVWTVYLPGC